MPEASDAFDASVLDPYNLPQGEITVALLIARERARHMSSKLPPELAGVLATKAEQDEKTKREEREASGITVSSFDDIAYWTPISLLEKLQEAGASSEQLAELEMQHPTGLTEFDKSSAISLWERLAKDPAALAAEEESWREWNKERIAKREKEMVERKAMCNAFLDELTAQGVAFTSCKEVLVPFSPSVLVFFHKDLASMTLCKLNDGSIVVSKPLDSESTNLDDRVVFQEKVTPRAVKERLDKILSDCNATIVTNSFDGRAPSSEDKERIAKAPWSAHHFIPVEKGQAVREIEAPFDGISLVECNGKTGYIPSTLIIQTDMTRGDFHAAMISLGDKTQNDCLFC
eukprot:TRINITY_DN17703_c0_g2_i1.p1 TRINITY_DN17703_c0_g2~~TRINITY_DN17703_c0_g2_i1.p1  ORF type:complete len:346 (+),score=68.23 TRINITY_DN17703_c0_g2_i1:221-1258(+)